MCFQSFFSIIQDFNITILGGNELVNMGLADDQHDWGADAVVDPWVTAVWERLLEKYPVPPGVS